MKIFRVANCGKWTDLVRLGPWPICKGRTGRVVHEILQFTRLVGDIDIGIDGGKQAQMLTTNNANP